MKCFRSLTDSVLDQEPDMEHSEMNLLKRCLVAIFGRKCSRTDDLLTRTPRTVVARFASGNVSLQRGRYLTKEDMRARLNRVLRYQFTRSR